MPICLRLLRQAVDRAFSRACAKTGKRMAARMAMIAITTSSSIKVNARCRLMVVAPQSGVQAFRRSGGRSRTPERLNAWPLPELPAGLAPRIAHGGLGVAGPHVV